MTVDLFFERLWEQYLAVTPSADSIHQLLGKGAEVVNDHIAVRTFNLPNTGVDAFAKHLIAMGYRKGGEYHFANKHLDAAHFEHDDPTVPKVFISELQVESLSPESQAIVQGLAAQVNNDLYQRPEVFFSGRPWQLSYAEYQTLLNESEYAAWLAAYGYRANHFTISVNQLAGMDDLQQVNQQLKEAGFSLNTAGGEIKGSPEVLLEQSATLADQAEVVFSDSKHSIPSCFYEFALRYPKPNGELYSGFVEASADKIFSSTDRSH
ncbi:DUF1338 domain-containing protein [Agarivorans sp. 1_MG-2023]|uniref:DUF1338 domain-containing protein n=1 Tax=Agarivorans sp. 1_MG-2023 TaxID=3062634 RepID=UPI0026E3E144|nr:DUF1338 domain-containing protein [Agarivorans sp. 1_MG-2023]MDO6765427.1 DUF1338 domain-containing protein [Agarivorans sp. 1_MG-2023]